MDLSYLDHQNPWYPPAAATVHGSSPRENRVEHHEVFGSDALVVNRWPASMMEADIDSGGVDAVNGSG